MAAKATDGRKVIATNRQARRDFELLESIECGVVLKGSEVKSLREAHVQFADANGWIRNGEVFLVGLHIAPYLNSTGMFGHDPDGERKLLLHRSEITRLKSKVDQGGLTLVPTSLYFKDGRVKVELALARGRNQRDKRQAVAKRDAELDIRRAMARSRRAE
jgi:SsrA-binding protein